MEKSFLNIVAEDLLKRYGTDLSHTVVVFPNKRASLLLNEEFVKSAKTTLWSPRYITISDLFRKQSKLVVADHIKLIVELYTVYLQITGSGESLDEFFSWGELLLSDFDDVDKNMGDSRLIFENTAQLHEYDTVSYLQPEQKEALKHFFSNFSDDQDSKIKKNFEMLWNKLGDIYNAYRDHLRELGIAYEGMLYRDVVEKKDALTLKADRYIFVGFNLVQKVEQQLFQMLENQSEVHYYWDYDEYYLKGNEAGKCINEYLKHYPNDIADKSVYQNFDKAKEVTFINASTEDIQARYISQWLTPERIKAGKRTAIVLCNEALLPTVVNCIPSTVEHVNITTGYPLASTPAATLVQEFFNLYRVGGSTESGRLRLRQVNGLLRHPYMQYISPLYAELMQRLNENHVFFPTVEEVSADDNLCLVFTPVTAPTAREANILIADRLMEIFKIVSIKCFGNEGDSVHDPLMQETLFRMYTLLSRLRTLSAEDGLDVDTITFQRLIMQAIRSASIPFHGEPIEGIQIMGVLETRNLDFDHILMLSCNEGNMPKGVNDSSFIPHVIRKAYSLTTVENKVGIYAYYFHRLIQRASDVEIAYNSSTEDGQTGEKSRFMSQLLAESKLDIKLKSFNASLKNMLKMPLPIEKDEEIMNKLNSFNKLSPSAINTYLRCPLQFFYKVVCGIKDESEDEDDVDLDGRVFGLIFHHTMQILYGEYVNRQITTSIIEAILKDPHKIDSALDKSIKIELFKIDETKADTTKMPRLDGTQTIQRNVIRRLVRQLLQYDKEHTPIQLKAVEYKIDHDFHFGNDNRVINLHGIIDRLDVVTGANGHPVMRVIDYKTGNSTQPSLATPEDIFSPEMIEKHSDYYLQTILYCLLEIQKLRDEKQKAQLRGELTTAELPVSPCLVYPSHVRGKNYSPVLTFGSRSAKTPIDDVVKYGSEFLTSLKTLLSEIFSKEIPFVPTSQTKRCEKCFFANICNSNK